MTPLYLAVAANGGWDAWSTEVIETVSCENLEQLRAREGFHMKRLGTYGGGLNIALAGRSCSDSNRAYRAANREAVIARKKAWYHKNKVAIHAKQKEARKCKRDAAALVQIGELAS